MYKFAASISGASNFAMEAATNCGVADPVEQQAFATAAMLAKEAKPDVLIL
jgi:hypothetical protein